MAGKRVLLTGAGSTCAELLGRWALERGAAAVQVVHRSENRVEGLRSFGTEPLPLSDLPAVRAAAGRADVTFDALGGPVGSAILSHMRGGTDFVGYGLLSGQALRLSGPAHATYPRFHLRDTLAGLSATDWQRGFTRVWSALRTKALPPVQVFPLHEWRRALGAGQAPGAVKALLDFRASGSR